MFLELFQDLNWKFESDFLKRFHISYHGFKKNKKTNKIKFKT